MATKAENIEKLKELGVELTGEESAEEIKALLKEKAPADEEADKGEDEEVSSKKGFRILDSNGKYIRTAKTKEEADSLVKIYTGRIER